MKIRKIVSALLIMAAPVLSWAQNPDPDIFAEIVAPLMKDKGVSVSVVEKRSSKPHLSLLKRDRRLKNAASFKAYLLELGVQPSDVTSVVAGKQKAGKISLTDVQQSLTLGFQEGVSETKMYHTPSMSGLKGPLLILTKAPEKVRQDRRLSRQIRLLTGSKILQNGNWVKPASPLSIFKIASPGRAPFPDELPAEVANDIRAVSLFLAKPDWKIPEEQIASRLSIKTDYGTALLRALKPDQTERQLAASAADADNRIRIEETAWCS